MRADVVAGGAATLILMWIAYTILATSSLAPPSVITNITLLVTIVGAGVLGLGFVLKGPHDSRRQGQEGKARR